MAKVNIEGVGVVNFPDTMTPEQIQQAIKTDILPQAKPQKPVQKPEELSMLDKALARIPISPKADYLLNRLRGFAMGAADPSVGAAQLVANAVGQGDGINQAIAKKEQEYESQRQSVGSGGFDAMRLAGNVASPANLVVAKAIPIPAGATTGKLVTQGAKVGAIGGASQPVADIKDGQSFGLTKAAQTTLGAIGGAALTPVMSKLGSAIVSRLKPGMTPEQIIDEAMTSVGITRKDLTQDAFDTLREQVSQSLKSGKKLDAAALLRKADFENLNMQPLQGQITRDPTQFAAERNLRAVRGVGEPIMDRMTAQNQRLQELLAQQAGGKEPYQAGRMVSESLSNTDEAMRKKVSDLYTAARQSAGKSDELPMQGLAQDFTAVLDDFADKVPSAIVNRMKSFGLAGGQQTKLYTVEEADKLLKLINQHVGNDPATNTALKALRDAVKKSVLDVTDDVFAAGRDAAAKRFQLQDMIPALKAASKDSVAADDFVNRFVINGKVDDMKGLSGVLRATDPAAYEEMRKQIGNALQRAAFGENAAGDAIFTPARYNKFLRNLGTDKLSAFFTKQEIEAFQRIGRVGAYINQPPAASPVLSNPNSWMLAPLKGLVESLPGGRYATALASVLKQTANDSAIANRALSGKIPASSATSMTPEQARIMGQMLSGMGSASGLASAIPLR